MPILQTPVRLLLATILLLGVATAQAQKALLGTWIGSGEDNKGEKIVIEKDAIVLADKRLPYSLQAPGVIVIGGEDGARAEFVIKGDVLTFTLDGEAATYKRSGGGPQPGGDTGTNNPPTPNTETRQPPNPIDNPRGTNPLGNPLGNPQGSAPPGDPFARPFRGKDIELVLEGTLAEGYRGKLAFQGTAYKAEATARGNDLEGRFQSGEEWFPFKARLDGDQLRLESGGSTYELAGKPLARAKPTNPLAKPTGSNDPIDPIDPKAPLPQALDGVYTGATKRFEHPRGWFGFDMPEGWSVHQDGGTGMLLNPGLTATDTLDAIVGMSWGRLEAAEQNVAVATIIAQRLPLLRQTLAEQGFTVGKPDGDIQTYRCKDVPGAVVILRGQTQQGKPFQVWFGGIVKRDGWIAVSGLMLEGKEQNYLPKLKRIFTSLEPRPPERNQKLEAALVGRTFSSSQYGRKTDSAHHASYAFTAGGSVSRRLITNVISKPGQPGIGADSETGGRYEVCGDVVFLYFESGQEVGQVVQQGEQVTGIRIGNAEYQ